MEGKKMAVLVTSIDFKVLPRSSSSSFDSFACFFYALINPLVPTVLSGLCHSVSSFPSLYQEFSFSPTSPNSVVSPLVFPTLPIVLLFLIL